MRMEMNGFAIATKFKSFFRGRAKGLKTVAVDDIK